MILSLVHVKFNVDFIASFTVLDMKSNKLLETEKLIPNALSLIPLY